MTATIQLENLGSMITYKDEDGADVCLGYLMDFGRGVYDPTLGKVEVSTDDVKTHNALLDAAMLKGLDESCKIGEHGTFYNIRGQVQTFMGTVVADERHTTINGNSLTFTRSGKTYRGRLQKDADCFNFKRIA